MAVDCSPSAGPWPGSLRNVAEGLIRITLCSAQVSCLESCQLSSKVSESQKQIRLQQLAVHNVFSS